MPRDWSAYFQASLDKPLHPLWAEIEPLLPQTGRALDLGCGVGAGTAHLAQRGLSVVAVDQHPEALAQTAARAPAGADVRLVESSFQTLDLQADSFDVVVAFFTLFFLDRAEFGAFWPRLVASIKPGGIFAGQILGPRDDWAHECATFTAGEIDALLAPFTTISREEVERDGETLAREPKHWHVTHVVAVRRPDVSSSDPPSG